MIIHEIMAMYNGDHQMAEEIDSTRRNWFYKTLYAAGKEWERRMKIKVQLERRELMKNSTMHIDKMIYEQTNKQWEEKVYSYDYQSKERAKRKKIKKFS